MITNNIDFYNYIRDKGEFVTLQLQPLTWDTDELVIAFPDVHVANVSCNAHTNKYIDEYQLECENIIDWLNCANKVIVITPVIKFDCSDYMKENAPLEYQMLKLMKYKKQVIHSKDIGCLINPNRLQIRYKGIEPIEFDVVSTKSIVDPKHYWISDGYLKSQQIHYLNVINRTKDKIERRKLRHIPNYTLFSQLYKKLCL